MANVVGTTMRVGWRECGVVRMGGGKRTFPGGVTKWQWKRLQLQKQRMRDKAWLARERRLYQNRKRAEMIAAAPAMDKPWEQQRFPARPVKADAQLSALADRFQKPGATDLWNESDGPLLVDGDAEESGAEDEEQLQQQELSFLGRQPRIDARGPKPLLPEMRRRDSRGRSSGEEGSRGRQSRGSSHRLWKIEDRR